MVRQRVRIRFSKLGDLRLIGHRDLMRSMERLFRRAGVKLAMSQGFHPKPRMTFPAALSVGIEGTDEVMELEVAEAYTADQLRRRIVPQTPSGLAIASIDVMPEGAKKVKVQTFAYEVPVPSHLQSQLPERIEQLLAAETWPLVRPNRDKTLDLRPLLAQLSLREGVLQMQLIVGQQGTAGPRDVLGALGLADLEKEGAVLRRTAVGVQT